MNKKRQILFSLLAIVCMSNGVSVFAQPESPIMPASNRMLADAETPPDAQTQEYSQTQQYAETPPDMQSRQYAETPPAQQGNPENNQEGNSKQTEVYNDESHYQQQMELERQRQLQHQQQLQQQQQQQQKQKQAGSNNNGYPQNPTPTNQPGQYDFTPAVNSLKWLFNQIGSQSKQAPAPVQQPTTSGTNEPGDVMIQTGDISDGDVGLFGTMLGQELKPEVVAIEAEPVDKAVVENIVSLEKSAEQATKETFAPVAEKAETLGSSLSGGSQIPEAAKSFDIAYKTRSRFVQPLDPSLMSSAVGLANSLFGGDNFETAVEWYQKSLAIIDNWTPSDPAQKDAALTKCLGGLTASYLAQNDAKSAKSALPYAIRLYDLVKSKYGAQSAQACWGAATLGECYRQNRMDAKLKPLQDEMFDICLEKAGGVKRLQSTKPGDRRNKISKAPGTSILEARSPVMPTLLESSHLNAKRASLAADMIDQGVPTGSYLKQFPDGELLANQSLALLPQTGQVSIPTFSQEVPMRFWFPASAPRAVIVCIHGMCLHSGSYSALAGSLQASGFLVVALDVRGCGTWVNSFGQNFLNLDGTLADIRNVVERLHVLLPRTPIFLLGESMGGGIALHAAARHPENIAGVISSVPGASRFDQAKETFMVLFSLPFGLNRPLNIGKGLLAKATDNPGLREFWKTDPLSRQMLSPKELITFQLFMSGNEKFAVRIKSKPVLVIQGMNDRLVKPLSTIKIYRRIASSNKTLLKVNSGEHLTFEMNQCSPVVLKNLVTWVQKNSH